MQTRITRYRGYNVQWFGYSSVDVVVKFRGKQYVLCLNNTPNDFFLNWVIFPSHFVKSGKRALASLEKKQAHASGRAFKCH